MQWLCTGQLSSPSSQVSSQCSWLLHPSEFPQSKKKPCYWSTHAGSNLSYVLCFHWYTLYTFAMPPALSAQAMIDNSRSQWLLFQPPWPVRRKRATTLRHRFRLRSSSGKYWGELHTEGFFFTFFYFYKWFIVKGIQQWNIAEKGKNI